MTYKKYRLIDLLIFFVLYCLFDFLISQAAIVWFPDSIYYVSLMLPILLLVMMRWGPFSLVHAIGFGAFFVLINSRPGTWQEYLIYIVGNLGFMLTYFFLKGVTKKRVNESFVWTALYCIVGFVLMNLFRGVTAWIVTDVGIKIIPQYFWTDMLNLVFAIVVCLIARKADGLFEDQKAYLFRKQREREEQQKKDETLK